MHVATLCAYSDTISCIRISSHTKSMIFLHNLVEPAQGFECILQYCLNAMLHSLDKILLVARSNSMFTILSRKACNSKVALHLVYNKTFIKQGCLTYSILYVIKPFIIVNIYHCGSTCVP